MIYCEWSVQAQRMQVYLLLYETISFKLKNFVVYHNSVLHHALHIYICILIIIFSTYALYFEKNPIDQKKCTHLKKIIHFYYQTLLTLVVSSQLNLRMKQIFNNCYWIFATLSCGRSVMKIKFNSKDCIKKYQRNLVSWKFCLIPGICNQNIKFVYNICIKNAKGIWSAKNFCLIPISFWISCTISVFSIRAVEVCSSFSPNSEKNYPFSY